MMMGAIATILECARQTLRLLMQNRLLLVALLAQGALALLIFVAAGNAPQRITGRFLYSLLSWWLLGNALLPLVTMYFGVQAVHGDIEDRTFQYLFLRPVPRWAILLGKYPANVVAPFTLLVPIFGIGFSLVLLGETISGIEVLGSVLVFAGLLVNVFGPRLLRRATA